MHVARQQRARAPNAQLAAQSIGWKPSTLLSFNNAVIGRARMAPAACFSSRATKLREPANLVAQHNISIACADRSDAHESFALNTARSSCRRTSCCSVGVVFRKSHINSLCKPRKLSTERKRNVIYFIKAKQCLTDVMPILSR